MIKIEEETRSPINGQTPNSEITSIPVRALQFYRPNFGRIYNLRVYQGREFR